MRFYILAASFLLTLAGQAGNWALWESPYRNAEVLDQRQTAEDSGYAMQGAAGVGQTFTPRATPLVRLDLRVKNRADVRPGLLRLWKWAGTPAATRMAPPLFEDVIDLTGRDSYQLRAFYPNLPVLRRMQPAHRQRLLPAGRQRRPRPVPRRHPLHQRRRPRGQGSMVQNLHHSTSRASAATAGAVRPGAAVDAPRRTRPGGDAR
jgi:hypothetical protein